MALTQTFILAKTDFLLLHSQQKMQRKAVGLIGLVLSLFDPKVVDLRLGRSVGELHFQ